MDPFMAVSLLCNILDLTERTYKSLRKAKETYELAIGLPEEQKKLLGCTNELAAIFNEVQGSHKKLQGLKSEDVDIKDAADRCQDLSSDIISMLGRCGSQAPLSIIGTVMWAVRSIRYEKRLQNRRVDLEKSQQTLHLALSVSARARIDKIQSTLEHEHVENQNLRQELAATQVKLGTLDDISNQLKQTLSLCHQAQKARGLNAILQALAEDDVRLTNPRYNEIFDASAGTFDWILREPTKLFEVEPGVKLTFVDWLRNGEGIFHVLGKPGSGKSTLMKFIWDHDITKESLKIWAGDSHLLCMKHFFWKPEPSQSGLRGLKSSLLSSMLEQAPDLLDVLIPGSKDDLVSYEKLAQALDLLLRSPQALGQYIIFLLIDGLDEFDEEKNAEDYHDLVHLIQTWASQSEGKVKICVSSREYEAFITMAGHQKIRLQKLTREDIQAYVSERLTSHPRFSQLETSCKKLAKRLHREYDTAHTCSPHCLIGHIVEVSDGVFLWVRLVMVQVRKCLSADSSLRKICDLVDLQPKPLADFIKHMLDSILSLYQREAYILLSIMHGYASFPEDMRVSLQGASYLSDQLDRAGTILLSQQAGPGDLILPLQEAGWRVLTPEEIIARFNGLLEVSDRRDYFRGTISILNFTHRSIIEVLRDNIDAKLAQHGITQIELGNWLCRILLGELRAVFQPLKDVGLSLALGYLNIRLTGLFYFLKDKGLLEEPSIMQQLDQIEEICLTFQFGSPQPSEEDWQRFYSWNQSLNRHRLYFSFLILATSLAYVEALPWIVKRLENTPKRGHLASILLFMCTKEWKYKSINSGYSGIYTYLTALLGRGFIGVDLLDGEQKAHVSKYGCHTTEPWVNYIGLLVISNSPSNNFWANTELWLDLGANPRICLVDGGGSEPPYVSVKINGKWLRQTKIMWFNHRVEERSLPGTLKECIARSNAPNKERLLELVDRNTEMIEAEEAADAS